MQKQLKQKDKFLEVEQKLLKEEPLILSGNYHHQEDMPFNVWLKNFLTTYNVQCTTRLKNNPDTIQCGTNKNRSIGDIYVIARSYYPQLTFKGLAKQMYKLDMGTMCCPVIKKVVYRHADERPHWKNRKFPEYVTLTQSKVDEHGIEYDEYIQLSKTVLKNKSKINYGG